MVQGHCSRNRLSCGLEITPLAHWAITNGHAIVLHTLLSESISMATLALALSPSRLSHWLFIRVTPAWKMSTAKGEAVVWVVKLLKSGESWLRITHNIKKKKNTSIKLNSINKECTNICNVKCRWWFDTFSATRNAMLSADLGLEGRQKGAARRAHTFSAVSPVAVNNTNLQDANRFCVLAVPHWSHLLELN